MNALEKFKADLEAKLATISSEQLQKIFEKAGVEFLAPLHGFDKPCVWVSGSTKAFQANANDLAYAA